MNAEYTFNTLCVLLEDQQNEPVVVSVETQAMKILEALDDLGGDLLEHLDPPEGLKTWLKSHGLSLVATREAPAPAVWASIEEGDAQDDLEEEREGRGLLLQVGGMVEYRTAPSGPRHESQIGMGKIMTIHAEDMITVTTGPGQFITLDCARDFIRTVDLPSP